jgi:hypothetical protein
VTGINSLVATAIPSSPTCISYGMSYTIFSKPFNYGQDYTHSCHYKKLLYFPTVETANEVKKHKCNFSCTFSFLHTVVFNSSTPAVKPRSTRTGAHKPEYKCTQKLEYKYSCVENTKYSYVDTPSIVVLKTPNIPTGKPQST